MKLFDVWKSEIHTEIARPHVNQAENKVADRSTVAYIVSRFPRITETFILREMLELERTGRPVLIFPLLRVQQAVRHPEVDALMPKVRYSPFFSVPILLSNWYWFRKSPGRYLHVLFSALRGCWGSANLFLGALGIFPKSAHFARLMEEYEIPHVHAHFATHPALAAWIISRLSGITYSFTAHAHDIFIHTQMLKEKIHGAQFVVAISQFNKDYLLKLAPDEPEEKIKVIHCGIDPSVYRSVVHPQKERFQILCVASLEPYKGTEYLLRACRILRERGLHFRCVIVGEGRERGNLETSIVDYGLGDVVQLLGAQPHEVVIDLIAESDIFVLPSVVAPDRQMEGIPVALMEAMAGGLPVIASDLSGISELVRNGHNGTLVSAGDYRAIADAVQKLTSDWMLRTRMGQHGKESVTNEFHLSKNVAALQSEFQKICRNRKGFDELLLQHIREKIHGYFPGRKTSASNLNHQKIKSGGDSHIYALAADPVAEDSPRMILKMHRPGSAIQMNTIEKGLSHAENEYRALQFLWSRFSDRSELHTVPKPLDFFPEHAAILMEEFPGQSMAQHLRWHRLWFSGSSEACAQARSCGEWLRLFHDITAMPGNIKKVCERIVARFQLDLESATTTGLPKKLARAIDHQLTKYFEPMIKEMNDTVGHHCDFGPYNIFFDNGKITVIDFEGMEDGLMYEDLCYFICMIQLIPRRHISQSVSRQTQASFLGGYFQENQVDRKAMDLFCLIQMVNIMAHNPVLSGHIRSSKYKRRRILGRFIRWFETQVTP